MERIIFHIDVNSAYLSWTAVEQLKNGAEQDLRKLNAIIGGNQKSRHGIVLAKSISAKQYGIKTGEPVANALRKCPNLVQAAPDHKLYSRYSKAMMDFLYTFTPDIEQVSIDECYIDFTPIASQYKSPVEAAFVIKDSIYKRFGFTVNVGISVNKLLAKMASDFEKPNKVHTLFPEEIQVKMWPLPISELYMAGHSSVAVMQKLEIRTIGDLAKADPALLELHLKSHGRLLWEFANGIDHSEVQSEQMEAKGIGNSTTLPRDIDRAEDAFKVLDKLSKSVGRRLRAARQKANMIGVEIKYHTFQKVSHQRQFAKATNQDKDLYEAACELFQELWNEAPIRLLGIRTSKLAEESEPEQMNIFEVQNQMKKAKQDEKKRKAEEAMEAIQKKFGYDVIKKGT